MFLSFSYIQSPSQPYNALPIRRPVSPFLQVAIVDGIPLSSCTVYRYLCGIFLDDISTREQFVCFPGLLLPSETVFHSLCTVLYWRLCSLTNSPQCEIYSQLRLMCTVMERRRFSQIMASEWQTAFVVSHKIPWSAIANCRQELQQMS